MQVLVYFLKGIIQEHLSCLILQHGLVLAACDHAISSRPTSSQHPCCPPPPPHTHRALANVILVMTNLDVLLLPFG